MKKATTDHISIPKPCNEPWANMTPAHNGRFCGSCQKTVIDFSVMNDAQVLDTIAKAAGGCCGRFAPEQLHRPMQMQASLHRVPFMPMLPAAILSAMLLLAACNNNSSDARLGQVMVARVDSLPHQFKDVTGLEDNSFPLGEVVKMPVISGHVSDQFNNSVAGAFISMADSAQQKMVHTTTDAAGNFELHIPVLFSDTIGRLDVCCEGYFNRQILFTAAAPYDEKFLEIPLHKNNPFIMGEFYISPLRVEATKKNEWHYPKKTP